MSVVVLADYKNTETISVLRCLLNKAVSGELAGMAMCFKLKDGSEEACFTGLFKEDPAKAVNAAMRLSWKLTQLQDDPL